MMKNQEDYLLEHCEARLKSMQFWAKFDHVFCDGTEAISLLFSILIPFGPAIMLYISQEHYRKVNLITLVVSFIALILQVLNSSFHFTGRSRLSKKIYCATLLAVADYKAGSITREQFRQAIGDMMNESVHTD